MTQDNQIPSKLVWRAKALYAKGGLQDSGLQAEWLLRAGDGEEAHEVLCSTVGPQAVIEQDYDWLDNLLQHFGGRRIEGWGQGGQVYIDFVLLVRAQQEHRPQREVEASIQRLEKGLAGMEENDRGKKSLEERVALIEMGRVLEVAMKEHGKGDKDHKMAGMEEDASGRSIEEDMLRRYQQAMGQVA